MSDQLPHHLQIHILVRLPVNSLLRFQCVSKSWKSVINSAGFISMHTNHNESINNYAHLVKGRLCLTDNEEEIDSRPKFRQFDDSFCEFQEIEFPSQTKDEYFNPVLDCRGLLLLCDRVGTFILWNPAVRMTMILPRHCIGVGVSSYFVHGFGFDPKSNDYKVLRIVYEYLGSKIFPPRAELFKLSTGAWETVRFRDNFHCLLQSWSLQTFVNGASHWVGYHSTNYLSKKQLGVLLFHMSEEEFRMMKLPDVLTTVKYYLISLVVSGGLLSLIYYNGGDGDATRANESCCIWLMKDYGVIESWTKHCIIELRDCRGPMSTLSFSTNRIMLLATTHRDGKELVLYDLKTNRFINLGMEEQGPMLSMNTYIESLVLLNQINVVPEYETSSRKKMQLTKWLENAYVSTIKYEENVRQLVTP